VSIAPVSEQRDALHYAPPPPLRRRRGIRRVALLLALLIAVGAGVYWFPLLREHVVLQVLQRRCMNYTPPADEVVFEKDAERAAQLLSDPRYQSTGSAPPATYLVPKDWADLYATLSPPGLKSWGTVFLGEMKTREGDRRLVAIDMTVENTSSRAIDGFLLTARVIEPASPLRRPTLVSTMSYRYVLSVKHYPVKPARRDPADPSHLLLFDGAVEARLEDPDFVTMSGRGEDPLGGWGARDPDAFLEPTPPAPSSPASLPTSARPAARRSASPALR
jgi:hypothetical protein